MSAQWDSKQGIAFYYGNAARDLKDTLPMEEHTQDAESIHADLHAILHSAEQHIAHILEKQNELSFLVSDLKRMIRK
ncbi:MAG: hypothetical protein JST16_01390 [Bdellovibrionales bacterium]|nr:hypothetical protein [Bdellovibrionales bacterium]